MTPAGCRPDKFTFTFSLKACADLSRRRKATNSTAPPWSRGSPPMDTFRTRSSPCA
ncbi:unnamed protein product [Spirodela intermedia]|uniref:Uncharacterized protein n=1 Tax=Spirodela intermedia TaxID=51605 RepID=A0A7I8JUE0_SPIIN|nr:unnamed protein product [Spirodela intermedia]CAA6673351.1 unnamed protein product [Spirodela intermedia]